MKQELYDAEVEKIEQLVEEDRRKFVKNKKIEYDRLMKQAVESKQRFRLFNFYKAKYNRVF